MKVRVVKAGEASRYGLRAGDIGELTASKEDKSILKIETHHPSVFHTRHLESMGAEWEEVDEDDGLLYCVLVENVLYGPFSQQEVGNFAIDYEASFEHCTKPRFQVLQTAKVSGGDAAYLHLVAQKGSC